MITDKDKFGCALVSWRQKKNLTEWECAKLSGLRIEQIRRLERGEGNVETLITYENWIRIFDGRKYWIAAPYTPR